LLATLAPKSLRIRDDYQGDRKANSFFMMLFSPQPGTFATKEKALWGQKKKALCGVKTAQDPMD